MLFHSSTLFKKSNTRFIIAASKDKFLATRRLTSHQPSRKIQIEQCNHSNKSPLWVSTTTPRIVLSVLLLRGEFIYLDRNMAAKGLKSILSRATQYDRPLSIKNIYKENCFPIANVQVCNCAGSSSLAVVELLSGWLSARYAEKDGEFISTLQTGSTKVHNFLPPASFFY